MLRSIEEMMGDKLGATDGEIGHVKDFYFDDRNWVIRYVAVDTGNWLPGRQVLISPHAFGSFYQDGKVLLVNLTRKQIEKSPSIESHKTVSRQFEEEYYGYYNWPYYWQGDSLWGMSGLPILTPPVNPLPANPPSVTQAREGADLHLQSARAVNGYAIEGTDGDFGHVRDFMMNDQSWAIPELIIKPGHFSSKEIHLQTSKITRVSYEESKMFVRLTKEEIEHGDADHLQATAVGV